MSKKSNVKIVTAPHLIRSLYQLIIPGYQKTSLVTISEVLRFAHIINMLTDLNQNITTARLSSGRRMSYFVLNFRTKWLMPVKCKTHSLSPSTQMPLVNKGRNVLKSRRNSLYLGWNEIKSIQHGYTKGDGIPYTPGSSN